VKAPAGAENPPEAGGRVLGFWSLLTLGINGIVGVGIFLAPSQLARAVPGPASALAFVITGVLLAPVAWTYGRLGSAYPEDGGPYVWARAALGERFAFGVGFVAFASAVLSTAAVVSALGQYLAPELGFGSAGARWAFQLAAAFVFSGITLLGLRLSAGVWSALTVLKLVPLSVLAWAGVTQAFGSAPLADHAAAVGVGVGSGLGRAALLAVFPLQGFEIVPVPAGEARAGRGTVLGATLLSLGFAVLLYVLLQLACVHALPRLAESSAPVVEAGTHYTHGVGRALFAAGANISAIGIAFGMFAMTPRYLAALGTESLLGRALARERRGVPVRALLVTTVAVLLLVSSSTLTGLFVLSSLAVLVQYAVSATALFRLATRGERGLGKLDRLLAPLTLLAIAVLAQAAQAVELLILAGILLGGVLLLRFRQALASPGSAR
jgi:basic amino acid/polyamine antiporter, APA family